MERTCQNIAGLSNAKRSKLGYNETELKNILSQPIMKGWDAVACDGKVMTGTNKKNYVAQKNKWQAMTIAELEIHKLQLILEKLKPHLKDNRALQAAIDGLNDIVREKKKSTKKKKKSAKSAKKKSAKKNTGVYTDNKQNRALKRVGKQY